MSKVLIHPASYENIGPAVDRAFEFFPLDLKGRKVLLKPNVLRASAAREGITTHPALVRAVLEKVRAMEPASLVVGDNPGLFNYGANEEAFRTTGLMEAAGPSYRNIGTDARKVGFNPGFIREVSVSADVLDADIVISLPRFKTHGLTVISGAIKNSYGILPGAQKAMLHRLAGGAERFHEMIVDVFMLRVPDLFIMDAVIGMEGNGPASPELRDVGLVLASDNAVAMDSVVATMMGCDPGLLRFLRKAREKGLGDYDPASIQIIGDMKVIPGFKLPPLGGEAVTGNQGMQQFISRKIMMRPRADRQSCTGCGTCVEHCPVSALIMQDGIPVVDADACISCFCCQEMCPEKAMTLA